MTKQEFLDKWGVLEFMIETNTDFKQMVLSNIEDIKYCRTEGEIETRVDAIKEFVMDFYSAQPKNVATHWF